MKVLITGANGFVGRNLVVDLKATTDYELFCFDIDNTEEQLQQWCQQADVVVHLAGVNRPKEESEFQTGNTDFTARLIGYLSARPIPVLMTSSIQAALDNPYGVSKLHAEEALLVYSKQHQVPVYIWRMPNIFGKWCRPNYNSVVATFCHNIAHNEPIFVRDPNYELTLIYIDDVVALLKQGILQKIQPNADGYCEPTPVYSCTLGNLASEIEAFRESRDSLLNQPLEGLRKRLYSTYLSYLPETAFSYPLKANVDARGAFSEFFKTDSLGQFSVSTTKPGITRGNHWHHTKVEKFLVVAGEADICFRKLGTDDVIRYHVTAENPEVVDIPVGYTHNITNTSDTETLVTLIWANELFDSEHPDTFYEEV